MTHFPETEAIRSIERLTVLAWICLKYEDIHPVKETDHQFYKCNENLRDKKTPSNRMMTW